MIVDPLCYVASACTGNMLRRVTRRNSAGDIAGGRVSRLLVPSDAPNLVYK
jgi:hypothetical protein